MQPDSYANCPECDRYIGPVSTCPYCDSKNRQSPILRTIRFTAIFLATAGLFMLYMTAKHREPPLVAIENITPAMNFAHVHIVGTLKKKPYISEDENYISFRIYSKTDNIQVVAYRKVAQALIKNNLLPTTGDSVDVRGNLSVSAQSKSKLYLKATNHLTVNPNKSPTDS